MAAVVLLLVAGPAGAFELKIWPLLRVRHDPAAGTLRWSALGPLVEYVRTPDARELFVRPLLWLSSRRTPPETRAEVAFPLLALRREPGHESLRFLLLSRHVTDRPSSRFTLFPLVFWRADERGSRLGVLPFFLHEQDVFGFDDLQIVAFPLWLRVRSQGVERRFHPFPFVSTVRDAADDGTGPGARGLRLWPVWGETDIPGREHTRYVLWPFWIDQERTVPEYGPERRRVRLPVWTALDGARRTSRGLGVLAYTHTVDRRLGSEAIGSPWPLVLRERPLGEAAWRTYRVAPFWGRSDDGRIRSRFLLWPLWRETDQDEGDFHARRRDVLLIIARAQWQWDEASGRRESLWTALPLGRALVRDGRASGQVLALADALVPRNRGVLAVWAPLWGLVRWETRADDRLDWSVLWGVLAREEGRLIGPVAFRP